jgi:hypothetical protein
VDGLTPGDFATVRCKRELFATADASLLARWPDEELEAKGVRAKADRIRKCTRLRHDQRQTERPSPAGSRSARECRAKDGPSIGGPSFAH